MKKIIKKGVAFYFYRKCLFQCHYGRLGFMLELSCNDAACLYTHITESFVGKKIRASEVKFLFVGRQTMIFNKEKL